MDKFINVKQPSAILNSSISSSNNSNNSSPFKPFSLGYQNTIMIENNKTLSKDFKHLFNNNNKVPNKKIELKEPEKED